MYFPSVLLILMCWCYQNYINQVTPSTYDEYDYIDHKLIILTKYGKVKGQLLNSQENRPFYAYKGIPFAKPPVGSLRFKAPLPPSPWNGIRDATKNSPMCIQKNYLLNKFPTPAEGKEDCLYLNVYTPKRNIFKQSLLPVMVSIHYGGFFAGTGNSDYIGPEYFMDKDVVLVSFNYRLGVFGTKCTNDDAAPGNWALKDQVAALRWVQENIAAFGGDPKKVTIFGDSSGASSGHLHQFSPSSKGLFHQCISESGSALAFWARQNSIFQEQVAQKQAGFVNCSSTDTETMVECVRNVDANTLAESTDMFKTFEKVPLNVYGPVTEKRSLANPEPFLENDPLTLLQSGHFNSVPWIIGTVEQEGILQAAPLLRNATIREALNARFDEYGPDLLSLSASVPQDKILSTWKKITDFYLQDDHVDINKPKSVEGFINMIGERFFSFNSYQSALLHALRGLNRVWFYKFNYRGEYSYGDKYATTTENINFKWGVCHTDDLLYLFTSPALFGPLKAKNDLLMKDSLIQMWTDFAIFGDPSPRNAVANLTWEPLPNLKGKVVAKNSDLNYLNITGSHMSSITLEMSNYLFPERMAFWESLPLLENVKNVH